MQPADTITVSLIEDRARPISRREAEVLFLLLQGNTTKDVAGCLHISTATVQKHLKNIYRKLGVHNRIEALQRTKVLVAAFFSNQN